MITLRLGHNKKPSCDASDCGRAGQSKNRQRAMEKNAQSREALQTPNLPAGVDKTAQARAALQTPSLAADPFHNPTLTRIGRITRSMTTASSNSARTAEADVMTSVLMSTAIDGDSDTYAEAMSSDKNELRKAAIRETNRIEMGPYDEAQSRWYDTVQSQTGNQRLHSPTRGKPMHRSASSLHLATQQVWAQA